MVPAAELVQRIADRHPLEAVEPAEFGEVAKRYRFVDGAGEVGFVTSVTQPFCGSCTRLRLSAVGELYTCLFGTHGLRPADARCAPARPTTNSPSRSPASGPAARTATPRSAASAPAQLPKVEMSYIGG